MMDMLEKLGGMQQKMDELKEKLNGITVEGQAEGISIRLSANREVKEINIAQALIDEGDKEKLEDMIILAFEKALKRADDVNEAEMRAMGTSLLPGLF